MKNDLDLNWFDLAKYEGLRNLDLSGWKSQITIRWLINYFMSCDEAKENRAAKDHSANNSHKELLKRHRVMALVWINRIKNNPIIEPHNVCSEEEILEPNYSKYPFNTCSVMSSSVIHMYYSGTNKRFTDAWECCKLVHTSNTTDEQIDLAHTPYDFLFKVLDITKDNDLTNIIVDLTATDEQIMQDFSHWLNEYRKATKYESNKKNFTDKNFSEWVNGRLLPYIDLTLVALAEKKTITKAIIAEHIFSDQDGIDFVGRLRKTTIPKAEWLMRRETLSTIDTQLFTNSNNKYTGRKNT